MGRVLRRVTGLWLTFAAVLLAPAVADAAPTGSVAGWRSPVSDEMTLTIWATPDGVALRTATASLGPVTSRPVDFRNRGGCEGLCPVEAEVKIDASQVPVGDQELVVRITDANGTTYELERVTLAVERPPVFNCPPGVLNCSVEIRIGSGDISPPSSPPGGPGGGGQGPSCRSPRLSMRLAEKPLRYRRGVPVLKRGRAYRYAGRLTCRINGARRPAPRGMPVQVRNRLRGGWTVVQPSIQVRKAGEVVARLAYRSRRTIIFRVRGAGGELVRVRIPIRVARR